MVKGQLDPKVNVASKGRGETSAKLTSWNTNGANKHCSLIKEKK